ncbi:MAG TPA: AAA family ATPase, partial [Candidatus Limnocylindria bacterium]|nr:AAA family ATPase [Candidatus Limnocylindria bacterium]
MSEYPVQISKVQAPPLREETLARDRLLEWLSVKIHRRAVLLIAEAGYGKTTLLADFSRRTRLRVLWFRLDRGDRDWVGLLAYLVAAVRIHVPDFGTSTSALLRETATAAPPLDAVLDTFLRELGGLPNDPTAIVFDDFHLVDDSPDVRHVLRELLTRGPERMSFVFASRREPPIRLARLRALGEVAELGTDDLRFDAAETERLFRETYAMRLEPAVLAELSRRTEGWAASLQLVRAAIHDRDPGQVRAFISSLSGAEGHLYEYLAEEVVGELPADLQLFLMRTSVLETVDLTLGPIAAEVDDAAARSLIDDGERHGLFGKGSPNSRYMVRAHPLVRDFLQDRLTRSIGEDGVQAVHLRVARVAESVDWRLAARHYLAASREDDARRVLSAAIEQILATGAYAAAQDLASSLPSGGLAGAADLVLRSRL